MDTISLGKLVEVVVEKDILITTVRGTLADMRSRADYYADLRDLCRGSITKREKQYKQKYPGNYKVEEYFETTRFHWNVRLRFDSPKDKIMFLLRYA